MDARVDVSVVIVNWNTRDLLLDVVDSLKATTHETAIEIIVVDNDSHDGSVAALTAKHPDVTVITNPDNYGFARANNIGFDPAVGQAYCLVNTDIVARDGVIDTLWAYLMGHPRVGAVAPKTLDGEGRVRPDVRRFPSLRNAIGDHLWLRHVVPSLFPSRSVPEHLLQEEYSAEVLSGSFLMVRREAVEDVGRLDEGFFFYGEDTDWGRRFRDAGWDCVYLPSAQAVHFGAGSTAAKPVPYYLARERADLRYWTKHRRPGPVAGYVTIRLLHNAASVLGWSLVYAARPAAREHAAIRIRGCSANAVWLVTRRELT